jgi:hypothetical protein
MSNNGRAVIKGEAIVIRLSLVSIADAVRGGVDLGSIDPPIRVTDPKVFAKEVVHALNREDDDGTTPIHRLFDQAFSEATEDGARGVQLGTLNETGDVIWEEEDA